MHVARLGAGSPQLLRVEGDVVQVVGDAALAGRRGVGIDMRPVVQHDGAGAAAHVAWRPGMRRRMVVAHPYPVADREGRRAIDLAGVGRALLQRPDDLVGPDRREAGRLRGRSEEHPSELQSPMRISYAVFCLKKNKYSLQYTV